MGSRVYVVRNPDGNVLNWTMHRTRELAIGVFMAWWHKNHVNTKTWLPSRTPWRRLKSRGWKTLEVV